MIKGVIFDHSTLRVDDHDLLEHLSEVLKQIRNSGIQFCVVSTNNFDIEEDFTKRCLPYPDHFVTKDDVGINKGSPLWVEIPAKRMGAEPHEVLYVGDDVYDWRSAINGGCMFQLAQWVPTGGPGNIVALTVQTPESVWWFISHFMMHPPRWEWRLDSPEDGVCIRSLLSTRNQLPCDPPRKQFKLIDVFHHQIPVAVGGFKARSVLFLHVIASARLEGLIPARSYVTIYPSHTPGKFNPSMEEYIESAAKGLGTMFRRDLLIRAVEAKDTSLARSQQKPVTILDQANTVHLNPSYKGKLNTKTVVVFDEFTTSGMSLEWARNLLLAGGATRVVLITIGKYGYAPAYHTVYAPVTPNRIQPFSLGAYTGGEITSKKLPMIHDGHAKDIVLESFNALLNKTDFPLDF